MAHSVLSDDDSKKLIRVWPKCLNAPERCHWVLSENGMVNRIWSYHSWDFEGRNIKKDYWLSKKILKFCVFKGCHLTNGSSEPNSP